MNFRDLGGLPTRDGRTIQPGRIFRTGHLRELPRPLSTYVDFRGDVEVARDGGAPKGCTWIRLTIDAHAPAFRLPPLPSSEDWIRMYQALFAAHRSTFAALVEHAATAPLPLVFGCAAGKDRTGLAAASLLSTLGVDEDAIVEDYARTTATLVPHVDRFAHYGLDPSVQIDRFLTARPEVMRAFLASVQLPAALALPAGVGAQLRARLLDPVASASAGV